MSLALRLLPILGVTFIDILGFSILLPIMPYFVKHFGQTDFVVGILFSTFALCQFAAGPVWGYVSDRMGRKLVLIISQIGATIGWGMLAFSPNIAWVFIARIVEGLSGGNISVTQAYVADLTQPHERTRAFALVGASFSASIVFGPVIGGFTLDRYGFAAPFLVAAGLQLLTLLLTIVMLPESRSGDDSKVATPADIVRSLQDRRIAPVLWQQWMFSLGLYAWFAVYALLLQERLGFTGSQSSYFFASFGVLSVVLQIGGVGPANDRLGDRVTSTLGIALALIGFLGVPLVHDLATLAADMVFFAIGMALARPALTSLVTAATPENQRGTILGVGSSLDSASGVLMPPLSTLLLQRQGPAYAGAISAFFASVALVMGLFAQMRERTAGAVAAGSSLPPTAAAEASFPKE